MSEAHIALLPDRGVISVTGPDAMGLLQGLVTNDMDVLAEQGLGRLLPAIHAALLSPQGKILVDFLIVKSTDGYLLDVAGEKAAELAKRLTMYRLRAKAEITDISASRAVRAIWGSEPRCSDDTAYADPRHAALGLRAISAAADANATATAAEYHAHRIALGIPEGGKDWDFGDTFPHEADFDLFHGVSFTKGCYVGQEVVARMHHKTVVRKRVVRVNGASDLPTTRPEVKAGDVAIGRLGSVSGRQGLAMLRLDRAVEAMDQATPLTVLDLAIVVDAVSIERFRAQSASRS